MWHILHTLSTIGLGGLLHTYVCVPQMGLSMAQQEEEESEMVTMQQVAGARYLRNHRLMAEIFNDIVVPDNVKGTYIS